MYESSSSPFPNSQRDTTRSDSEDHRSQQDHHRREKILNVGESSSNTKGYSAEQPRVLTRSVIPTLAVTALDAGDVLECYHLTRTTKLHNTDITITKSALGVRYRRPANEMIYSSTRSSSSPQLYYTDNEDDSNSNEDNQQQQGHQHIKKQAQQQLQQRLELTIEFGPARVMEEDGSGAHESIPQIHTDHDETTTTEETHTDDDDVNSTRPKSSTSSSSVRWDNLGRVYYTERIDSDTYTTATYLASLSGNILTKLLHTALDFNDIPSTIVLNRRHPRRYQPFAIYYVETNITTTDTTANVSSSSSSSTPPPPSKLLLKSSNDGDFLQHLFMSMAELGVSLQPVILPTTYELRLHATSITKVKTITTTTTSSQQSSSSSSSSSFLAIGPEQPVLFYQRLSDCIHAIATANYTAYNTSVASSSTSSSTTTTTAGSPGNSTTTPASNNNTAIHPSPVASMVVRPPSYQHQQAKVPTHPSMAPHQHRRRLSLQQGDDTVVASPISNNDTNHSNNMTTLYITNPVETASATSPMNTTSSWVLSSSPPLNSSLSQHSNNTSSSLISNTSTSTLDPSPTTSPIVISTESPVEDSMASHQNQAQTAAQQAKEAADKAGAAGTEGEAVSAAQEAAVAAQKAATVTAQQAASMARDAILSGVGSSVAQAVALCFSDPMYGLVTSTITTSTPSLTNTTTTTTTLINGTNVTSSIPPPTSTKKTISTTTAYMYWDGTYYYRVNLTAPYVTVVSSVRAMPQPPVLGIGREDFVDWAIALLLAACTAVGFLLLLQQVMGRNLKVIRPLYRYQRWFFAPTQYAWKDVSTATFMDDSESVWTNGSTTRGIGQQYTFGEDVIPLSMGGRRPQKKADYWLQRGGGSGSFDNDDLYEDYEDDDHNDNPDPILGDFEMTDRVSSSRITTTPPPPTSTPGSASKAAAKRMMMQQSSFRRASSFHSDNSIGGGGGGGMDDEDLIDTPIRLYRDPNLVDLPDLTSHSKVAVPVSVTFGTHGID